MRREKLYAFAVAPLLLTVAAGCGEVTDAPKRLGLPGSLEFSSVAVKKDTAYALPAGRFTIVGYYDESGCLECRFSLREWAELADALDSVAPGRVNVALVFAPSLRRRVRSDMVDCGYRRHVAFDVADSFRTVNSLDDNARLRHALLAPDGRVAAYGDPSTDPEARRRFIAEITGMKESADPGAGMVEITPRTIDLGRFDYRQRRDTAVTIKNIGTEAMAIVKVHASCNCTAVEWPQAPIAAGDSALIRISYEAGKPTAVKRNVLVYVTSQRRPIAVDITGEAIGAK